MLKSFLVYKVQVNVNRRPIGYNVTYVSVMIYSVKKHKMKNDNIAT